MARRRIHLIERIEIIYRWHRGDSQAAIERSLGATRKTVRHLVRLAQAAGLKREAPLPSDTEIAALIAPAKQQHPAPPRQTPGKERLAPFDAQIAAWSKDPAVSIKQMWRLFHEQHPEVPIGITCFREYVRQHHRPVEITSTVRLVIPPGNAQVDFAYVGRMSDPKMASSGKLGPSS